MEILKGINGNAEQTLIENGFKVISSWLNDAIYSKNGKNYTFMHPIWNGNNVRILELGEN